MRASCAVVVVGVGAALTSGAGAFEYRCRWVERIGNTDIVLGEDGATAILSAPGSHRIRLQMGVFDSDSGPAPAGGFLGWNVGVLEFTDVVGGTPSGTRTPGRLIPWVFSPNPSANGVPLADPFTRLEQIDNTIGFQQPFWGCGPDGQPLPQPQPIIRALNEFESLYEFTVDLAANTEEFTISASGNRLGTDGWRTIGSVTPPDCETGEPGFVHYAPIPTEVDPFECTLEVIIPTPGGAVLLGLCGAVVIRRRR